MTRDRLLEIAAARWVIAVVLLFVPLAGAQPAGSAADLTRALVVQVREVERDSDIPGEGGCGLVIGWDQDTLTILTARHVVAQSLTDAQAFRVDVQFQGMERWVDAQVRASPEGAGAVDAAVLVVKRASASFPGEPPVQNLAVSPVPAPGSRVWVYGAEAGKDPSWLKGVIKTSYDDIVVFDARGVVGGFSGGVVVSELGVVGMTVLAGPDGQGHRALTIAPLLKLAQAAGASVRMKTNPVHEALQNMFARKLVAAAETWDFTRDPQTGEPFVVALLPREQQGDKYLVDVVTALQPNVAGTITPGPNRITLDLDDNLACWPYSDSRLPSGQYDLEVSPTVSLPGFVVLAAAPEGRQLFLAIPTANCELLAARALASAAAGRAGGVREDKMGKTLYYNVDRRSGGELAPFSICVRPEMMLDFKPLLQHYGDKPVTLAGRLLLPDVVSGTEPAYQQRAEAVWTALRLQVVVPGPRPKPLAEVPLSWEPKDVRLTFVPPTGVIRLMHSGGIGRYDYKDADHVVILLQGLRIEYTD